MRIDHFPAPKKISTADKKDLVPSSKNDEQSKTREMGRIPVNASNALKAYIRRDEWEESRGMELERVIRESFKSKVSYCFNYLMLDPRMISSMSSPREIVSSCFYTGKGQTHRPLKQLFDAFNGRVTNRALSKKEERIWEIWDSGRGVIIVEFDHGNGEKEALSRECCIISAYTSPEAQRDISLMHLTNRSLGTCYGPCALWSQSDRASVGTSIIKRVMTRLASEGIGCLREIRPEYLPDYLFRVLSEDPSHAHMPPQQPVIEEHAFKPTTTKRRVENEESVEDGKVEEVNVKAESVTSERRLVRSSELTPVDEPKKLIRCHFIGVTQVPRANGLDVLYTAIDCLISEVDKDLWVLSDVSVDPSTLIISEANGAEIATCSIGSLSFLGIGRDMQHFAFIKITSHDSFLCYVFHVEPSAALMAKTIEAACKLRYQKLLDDSPRLSSYSPPPLPIPPCRDGGGIASVDTRKIIKKIETLEEKRERERIARKEYRERKKGEIETLQSEIERLSKENQRLREYKSSNDELFPLFETLRCNPSRFKLCLDGFGVPYIEFNSQN